MIALLVQEVSPPDSLGTLGPHGKANVHSLIIGLQIGGDVGDGVDRNLADCEAFVLQGH